MVCLGHDLGGFSPRSPGSKAETWQKRTVEWTVDCTEIRKHGSPDRQRQTDRCPPKPHPRDLPSLTRPLPPNSTVCWQKCILHWALCPVTQLPSQELFIPPSEHQVVHWPLMFLGKSLCSFCIQRVVWCTRKRPSLEYQQRCSTRDVMCGLVSQLCKIINPEKKNPLVVVRNKSEGTGAWLLKVLRKVRFDESSFPVHWSRLLFRTSYNVHCCSM